LAPASDALTSPCLSGPITEYDWAEGIALITIFLMFFIELMAARFDVFGEQAHDIEPVDPSINPIKKREKYSDSSTQGQGGKQQISLCASD
jgi:solute carrier family 39 (zinc transporter), member 1/2/3